MGVPLFEKDARPRLEIASTPRESLEPALELESQRLPLRFAADDAGEHANHLKDVGDGPLVERKTGSRA